MNNLETRAVFSRISMLTWTFGGAQSDSALTFFKMASAYGNFLYNDIFHAVNWLLDTFNNYNIMTVKASEVL